MANPHSLLEWSIKHADPAVMSEQARKEPVKFDRKWIDAIFDCSSIKLMKECLAVLVEADGETSVEAKVTALKELEYHVEDLDNASELHKIGALVPVFHMARFAGEEALQFHSLEVLATCMRDLTNMQDAMRENTDYVAGMLEVLKAAGSTSRVRRSCLRGLAAYTSHNRLHQVAFIKQGGWNTLVELSSNECPRVRARVYIQIGSMAGVLTAVPAAHESWQRLADSLAAEQDSSVLERAVFALQQLRPVRGCPLLQPPCIAAVQRSISACEGMEDEEKAEALASLQELLPAAG